MNQRFTLDRKSFEQFIAAISIFQSLQPAGARNSDDQNAPLLEYLIETLRAIDCQTLPLQAALERVAGLALPIVGGERAVVWLFSNDNLFCRAAAGASFEDNHIHTPLRAKLQSAGAFGDNPPARLDLTRTLETNSRSLGSSLAIALLPGAGIAGALAVFSDSSRTFTERNYANLRLLAGLAQYILTKWAAERDQPESPAAWPAEFLAGSPFPGMRAAFPIAVSASVPIASPAPVSQEPSPEPRRHDPVPDFYVPFVSTRGALGGEMNDPTPSMALPDESENILSDHRVESSPECSFYQGPAFQRLRDNQPIIAAEGSRGQATSPRWANQLSPTLQRWVKKTAHFSPGAETLHLWENWRESFKRRRRDLARTLQTWHPARTLNAAAWGALETLSHGLRNVRRNRVLLGYAAPMTILAVMSFFVGHLTGGRQRFSISALNPVAQAATQPIATHDAAIDLNQKTSLPKPLSPSATSHLQITDPETAATIANLGKYEVQSLRRAADYGDDEAALQLGMLHELGRSFPQSCRQAAGWVTKAAQEGNAAAQYNLGLRYRDGDGVEANLQQAEKWLRKAAARKNLRAVRALAELPSQHQGASVSQITGPSQRTIAMP